MAIAFLHLIHASHLDFPRFISNNLCYDIVEAQGHPESPFGRPRAVYPVEWCPLWPSLNAVLGAIKPWLLNPRRPGLPHSASDALVLLDLASCNWRPGFQGSLSRHLCRTAPHHQNVAVSARGSSGSHQSTEMNTSEMQCFFERRPRENCRAVYPVTDRCWDEPSVALLSRGGALSSVSDQSIWPCPCQLQSSSAPSLNATRKHVVVSLQ